MTLWDEVGHKVAVVNVEPVSEVVAGYAFAALGPPIAMIKDKKHCITSSLFDGIEDKFYCDVGSPDYTDLAAR